MHTGMLFWWRLLITQTISHFPHVALHTKGQTAESRANCVLEQMNSKSPQLLHFTSKIRLVKLWAWKVRESQRPPPKDDQKKEEKKLFGHCICVLWGVLQRHSQKYFPFKHTHIKILVLLLSDTHQCHCGKVIKVPFWDWTKGLKHFPVSECSIKSVCVCDCVCVCQCVCVCVCVWERERERENQEMVHAFPGKEWERYSRRERRGRGRPTDWQRQKLRETGGRRLTEKTP